MVDQSTVERLKDLACEARKNILRLCHKATHIGGVFPWQVMTLLYQYGMKPTSKGLTGKSATGLSRQGRRRLPLCDPCMAGYFSMDEVWPNTEPGVLAGILPVKPRS